MPHLSLHTRPARLRASPRRRSSPRSPGEPWRTPCWGRADIRRRPLRGQRIFDLYFGPGLAARLRSCSPQPGHHVLDVLAQLRPRGLRALGLARGALASLRRPARLLPGLLGLACRGSSRELLLAWWDGIHFFFSAVRSTYERSAACTDSRSPAAFSFVWGCSQGSLSQAFKKNSDILRSPWRRARRVAKALRPRSYNQPRVRDEGNVSV